MIFFFYISFIEANDNLAEGKKLTAADTTCFRQLGSIFQQFCIKLNLPIRIDLAVKMMKCKRAFDKRDQNLPSTNNSTEYISQLSENDYRYFTDTFLSIDSTCFKIAQVNQTKSTLEKVLHLGEAIGLSAEFISKLHLAFKDFAANVTYIIQSLEDDVFEELIQTRDLLLFLEHFAKNLYSTISKMGKFYHSISLMKSYIFALTTSFFISTFLLPNFFFTILSVTIIFILCSEKCNHLIFGPVIYFIVCFILLIFQVYFKFYGSNDLYPQKKGSYYRIFSVSKNEN